MEGSQQDASIESVQVQILLELEVISIRRLFTVTGCTIEEAVFDDYILKIYLKKDKPL